MGVGHGPEAEQLILRPGLILGISVGRSLAVLLPWCLDRSGHIDREQSGAAPVRQFAGLLRRASRESGAAGSVAGTCSTARCCTGGG
jgi:hypothetical protein